MPNPTEEREEQDALPSQPVHLARLQRLLPLYWRVRNTLIPPDSWMRRVYDQAVAPIKRRAYAAPAGAEGGAAMTKGWFERVVWLTDTSLILDGWVDAKGPLQLTASCTIGGRDTPVPVALLQAAPLSESRTSVLAVANFPAPIPASDMSKLGVRVNGDLLLNASVALHERALAARPWITMRSETAAERKALLHAMALATLPERRAELPRWRAAMADLVDASAVKTRPVLVESTHRQGVCIDHLYEIEDRVYVARGWVRDADAPLKRLTLVSEEGVRAEPCDSPYRYLHPPAADFFGVPKTKGSDRLGFLAVFRTDVSFEASAGWQLEMEDQQGRTYAAPVLGLCADLEKTRDSVLELVRFQEHAGDALIESVVHPALSVLQKRRAAAAGIEAVTAFGHGPADPQVSIIVPLYKRIDFLEHQMAQFAGDPELQKAEIIYVLDSPEDEARLLALASGVHELYRVPFRVAIMKKNAGYSAANNAAAALARGRLLLLLNSDVIPDRPGWLGQLVDFHDSKPGVGAVAPKLVYEDESIQHAGMYFRLSQDGRVFINEHSYKGLHRTFGPANVSRLVPAVTGACLLLRRELYERLQGLTPAFVDGDYEDSDLCLRLAQLGLSNWYCASVELYHLEGQSYPGERRSLTWRYNSWLHTALWGQTIRASLAEPLTVVESDAA
jgi:GT2 family glycosyltransferase